MTSYLNLFLHLGHINSDVGVVDGPADDDDWENGVNEAIEEDGSRNGMEGDTDDPSRGDIEWGINDNSGDNIVDVFDGDNGFN